MVLFSIATPSGALLEMAAVTRRAVDANEAQFAQLFDEYSAPIFNYVLRMVDDADRAADITQDTFIKAYRKLDTVTMPHRPAPGCTGSLRIPPSTTCAAGAWFARWATTRRPMPTGRIHGLALRRR
jgi:hypothetical protein